MTDESEPKQPTGQESDQQQNRSALSRAWEFVKNVVRSILDTP